MEKINIYVPQTQENTFKNMQEKSQLETRKVARGSESYIAIRITTECQREYES